MFDNVHLSHPSMGGESLSQNLLRKTIVLSYCSSNDAVEAAVGTCGPHHLDFTVSMSVKY